MTQEEYNAIPAIRSSDIKAGTKSMLHMHHAITEEVAETAPMRWGRLVHAAVLEPRELSARLAVYDGTRRGKEWDAFVAEHDPAWIVKPDELGELSTMRAALHGNQDAIARIRHAKTEHVLTWTDAELGACKARLDGFTTNASGLSLVEYKTCAQIERNRFQSQAWGMGYHLQLAWYAQGMQRALGAWPVNVWLIAQESKPPYDVVVYSVSNAILLPAYEQCVEIVKRYRAHEAAGTFPGVADQVLPFEPPAWARGGFEEVPTEEMEASEL